MALGTMNHLALTLRNLSVSEAAFYAPVLEFLGCMSNWIALSLCQIMFMGSSL